MNIYLLTRTDSVGYDECDGFVVRALRETAARSIAAEECGDEGPDVWMLDAKCEKIGEGSGKPRIILRSYNAG